MASTDELDLQSLSLNMDDAEHILHDGMGPMVSRLSTLIEDSETDFQACLKLVLEAIPRAIPCRYAVYQGFDLQSRQYRTQLGVMLPHTYYAGGTLSGNVCFETLVTDQKHAAVIHDLQNSTFALTDPNVRRHQLKAYLGAAVRVNNEVVGALAVFHDHPCPYDADQSNLLEIMARVVAQIEAHGMAQVRLNRNLNTSRLIAMISATAITTSPSSFLQYCLKKVGHWSLADGAAFFWKTDPPQLWHSKFEYWLRISSVGRPVVEPRALKDLDIVSHVIESRQPAMCMDRAVLDSEAMLELFQGRQIHLALFLPLYSQTETLGLCCLHFDKDTHTGTNSGVKALEEEDIDVLMTVMGIVAQWRVARAISIELDETQALNQQMLQLSPTAIYSVDFRTNRLTQVNDFFLEYSGYSEAELFSMNPEDLLTPESREAYRQRMLAAVSGEKVPDFMEYQIVTKSGKIQWARMQVRFCYEDGRIVRSIVVAHNITEQKKIMQELSDYRWKLEALVEERTRALSETNQRLQEEIVIRTQTAKQLQRKTERLKELNTAMSVLLDKRNEDRLLAQEHIQVNVKQLVEPYLERLGTSGLNPTQRQLLEVIHMNISEVVGAPIADVSEKYYIFSPGELQVANLIRAGKTTKDIARLLTLSARTVEAYRNSIRKKLGLKNRRVNLRAYLSSKE